jgi:hypothetical protein
MINVQEDGGILEGGNFRENDVILRPFRTPHRTPTLLSPSGGLLKYIVIFVLATDGQVGVRANWHGSPVTKQTFIRF